MCGLVGGWVKRRNTMSISLAQGREMVNRRKKMSCSASQAGRAGRGDTADSEAEIRDARESKMGHATDRQIQRQHMGKKDGEEGGGGTSEVSSDPLSPHTLLIDRSLPRPTCVPARA